MRWRKFGNGWTVFITLCSSIRQWSQVLSAEFNAQQQKLGDGVDDVIDSYDIISPCCFFAVVTVKFFEKPDQLEHQHPKLYNKLYKQFEKSNFFISDNGLRPRIIK